MPETNHPSSGEPVVTGLIFAGGRASRLGGVDKARLRVGGRPLAKMVMAIIKPQCDDLVVLTGTREGVVPEGTDRLADPGQGPAHALVHGVMAMSESDRLGPLCLTASVDAPFMPSDMCDRLRASLSADTQAVVAAFDGRAYPTHALWRSEALLVLEDSGFESAGLSLFGLLDRLRWRQVDFAAYTLDNPFLNVNSPADLLACNRRLMGGRASSFS